MEKEKFSIVQQVHPSNGNLHVNEYTFKLLQWLKMRVYLYAAKTLHFTCVYNLKNSCDLYTFLLYMIWKMVTGPKPTDQANRH